MPEPDRDDATLCDPIIFESNGASNDDTIEGLEARWVRGLGEDEWVEGVPPVMSSSPTAIVDSGDPIPDPTPSSQWIDKCVYDASVSFPSVAANFPGTWATSGGMPTVDVADGIIEWTQSLGDFEDWVLLESDAEYETSGSPSGMYTARLIGSIRKDMYLADTTITRGLRVGFAMEFYTEILDGNISGSTGTAPSSPSEAIFNGNLDEMEWTMRSVIYIKTTCDYDNVFDERNVQIIELLKQNYTTFVNISSQQSATGSAGNFGDAVANLKVELDALVEMHRDALLEYLSNIVFQEDQQRRLPVEGPVSFRLRKEGSLIQFELLNQYPMETYVDAFNSTVLRINFPQAATAIRGLAI